MRKSAADQRGLTMTAFRLDRLSSLRVADVMNRDVVQLPSSMTMGKAAKTLAERQISGAPVVDEQGRCVGVLSTTNFVYREASRQAAEETPRAGEAHRLVTASGAPIHIETIPEEAIFTHMSPAVQTISPDAPLVEAARIMCAEHVHRIPVTDESARVVGMITSLDLVAAMVGVIDEAEQE
jgi:CBS domain-containing protein